MWAPDDLESVGSSLSSLFGDDEDSSGPEDESGSTYSSGADDYGPLQQGYSCTIRKGNGRGGAALLHNCRYWMGLSRDTEVMATHTTLCVGAGRQPPMHSSRCRKDSS